MSDKYLTPQVEIEVGGQLATRDVHAEIHAQQERLYATTNRRATVVGLSEDAYLVLYLQEHEGLTIRRVGGHGVIVVLHEETQPHRRAR